MTGRVAVVAGRLIDHPQTPPRLRRFPPERADAVKTALRRAFIRYRIRTLIASAACGADLLALDVAGELGIRRRIVLPRAVRAFEKSSVRRCGGDWPAVYQAVVEAVRDAGDLIVLPRTRSPYRAANLRLLDEARAEAGRRRPLAIVVWDGPRGAEDMTAHFRDEAERRGLDIVTIRTM